MSKVPMQEILAGLNHMIEVKLTDPGLTDEESKLLKEVKEELNSIATKTWLVEDLTELNVRLEKLTAKLNTLKD